MSCYGRDDPNDLKRALESLSAQTRPADEVLLIEDGPLTEELDRVIGEFEPILPMRRIKFPENKGLGHALKNGVEACRYEVIARMDADDICRKDRFEKQLDYMKAFPELSVVGSWISEFEENEAEVYAYRKVPLTHKEIYKTAKYRSPLNHVTVMYKKEAVLTSGNYDPHFRFAQDYVLWMRMLARGYKFANIPEYLVNVKAGDSMIKRRGGLKYMKYETALQKQFLKEGFINYYQYCLNVVVRSALRLMPDQLRSFTYQKMLRR